MIVVNNDYEDVPLYRIQDAIYSKDKNNKQNMQNLIITSISKFQDVALWNGATYYIDMNKPSN